MKHWKKLYGASFVFTCPYCAKDFPASEATKDHIIPRSRGGKNTPDNITLSCKECNNKKGALTDKEFIEWKHLEFIRNGGLSK